MCWITPLTWRFKRTTAPRSPNDLPRFHLPLDRYFHYLFIPFIPSKLIHLSNPSWTFQPTASFPSNHPFFVWHSSITVPAEHQYRPPIIIVPGLYSPLVSNAFLRVDVIPLWFGIETSSMAISVLYCLYRDSFWPLLVDGSTRAVWERRASTLLGEWESCCA